MTRHDPNECECRNYARAVALTSLYITQEINRLMHVVNVNTKYNVFSHIADVSGHNDLLTLIKLTEMHGKNLMQLSDILKAEYDARDSDPHERSKKEYDFVNMALNYRDSGACIIDRLISEIDQGSGI